MAFKIVEKKYGWSGIGNNEISINKYASSFGLELSKKFEGFTFCEVYLDQENSRVGFKPSNDNIKGFKVAKDKKGRTSITGNWVKRLNSMRGVGLFEDGMIILSGCQIRPEQE